MMLFFQNVNTLDSKSLGMLRELSLTFLTDVTVKHGDKMENLKTF